jgi:uncharacterized protein involved in exopolysaccharide biosynthesis
LAVRGFDPTLGAMDEGTRVDRGYSEVIPAERVSPYLLALRERWWLVLGTTLAAASAGVLMTTLQQSRYDATAKVLLTNAEPVNVLLHSTEAPSQDPERDLNTEAELVKLDSIARRVRKQLGLRVTVRGLLNEVSAAPAGTSNLLAITVRDTRPATAAAVANAFAAAYVALRRHEAQDAYRSAADQAQLRLDRLPPDQYAGAQGVALRKQLQDLQVAGALQTGGAQVVDTASPPTSAATPKPKLAAVVGAFLGFLIGALAAIAVDRMPRSWRGEPDDDAPAAPSTNGSGALAVQQWAEHLEDAEKPHAATEHGSPHQAQLSPDHES